MPRPSPKKSRRFSSASRLSTISGDSSIQVRSTVFKTRKYPTLTSLESYVLHSRYQGSYSDAEILIANHPQPRDSLGLGNTASGQERRASQAPSITSHRHRGSTYSRRNKRKRSVISGVSGGTGGRGWEIRTNYYAGIAHSDLDVQHGRPPLMFQMHFVEWLWFQSEIRHRILFMGLAILLCIAVVHLLFGLIMLFTKEPPENPYLCTTYRCKFLSQRLLSKLNKKVNPCDDFYSFVCGSKEVEKNLTEEEDYYWNYGFDAGRVVYDFQYSKTLGKMLKKKKDHPSTLVLDMYQSCLDTKKRNRLGLQPFFDFLAKVGLKGFSIQKPPSAKDVAYAIAMLLTYSMASQGILNIKFARDYDIKTYTAVDSYVEAQLTDPIRSGPTYRYGYKRYYDTIYKSLSMMKGELDIENKDLEVLSHDILCLELLFRDVYKPEFMDMIVKDKDNIRGPCQAGTAFTGGSADIVANFGLQPGGKFDYEYAVRELYKSANPDWDITSSKTPFTNDFKPPLEDPRTDLAFVDLFNKEFERSAPLRFIRYLQWRLFYRLAFQLDDKAIKVMLPVGRHHYLGKIVNCFHTVFTWMPFLSPSTFLKSSDIDIKSISREFEYTSNQTTDMYNARASFGIWKGMERVLGKTLTDREKKIVTVILLSDLRVDSLPPVNYNEKNFNGFKSLVDLYRGISFDKSKYFENIVKMGFRKHEWKVMPTFANILYEFDEEFRVTLWFDKSRTMYDKQANGFRILLPMPLTESPFLNDGLRVSDLGGLGFEIAGNLEKTFYSSLHDLDFSINTGFILGEFNNKYINDTDFQNATEPEIEDVLRKVVDYYDRVAQQYLPQIKQYQVGGKTWDQTRYESAMTNILILALFDQSRYHAMSLVVNQYLKNPNTTWNETKAELRGLEEYNPKQIFYMALVNRRCERLGKSKLHQISEYGPLPMSISTNLALSNLGDFGKTFNCTVGSPMNRAKKIYFWDSDFDINDVNLTSLTAKEEEKRSYGDPQE